MRKIILFVDRDSGSRGRFFLQQLQHRLSGKRIEVCQSVEACAAAVCRVKANMDIPIVVLVVTSNRSLDNLYMKKQIFEDKKIVMVLPEEKTEEFTAMIHRFFPRYVAFMDDRYDDLCDVLNKMMVQ